MNNNRKKINREQIPAILAGRWGYSVLEQSGWTTIPNLLLENQQKFKLSNTEMLLLIHLISFMHYAEAPVFPSIETLSLRINQHPRTVQRTIAKLIKQGLISRKIRSKSLNDKGLSNLYDIAPLIKKLLELQQIVNEQTTFALAGETCPETGVWYAEEERNEVFIMSGNTMPPTSKDSKWILKTKL